jgi:hypothetical protein
MTILLVEHPISDYETWRAAFDRFEQVRADAGVVAHHVSRPIDDDHYVVIQLELPDPDRAAAFLEILRSRIWANPERSPALRGEPRAVILQPAG